MTVRAILGDEPGDDREIVFLNRLLKWREDRLEYEADPNHCQRICKEMGPSTVSNCLEKPVPRKRLTRSGMTTCKWSCARRRPQSSEDRQGAANHSVLGPTPETRVPLPSQTKCPRTPRCSEPRCAGVGERPGVVTARGGVCGLLGNLESQSEWCWESTSR